MANDPTRTPRIPAEARARIEQALVQAERALTDAEAESPTLDGSEGVFVFIYRIPLHTKMLPAVLTVLATIVEVLGESARRYAWTADRLRAAVRDRNAYVTPEIHESFGTPGPATLRLFQHVVARESHATLWWRAYLDTLEKLSVAVIPFNDHLRATLDELEWTVEQTAEAIDIDRTAVQDHLDGLKLPNPTNLAKYEAVISEAVGWQVNFTLPPKSLRTARKPRKDRTPHL